MSSILSTRGSRNSFEVEEEVVPTGAIAPGVVGSAPPAAEPATRDGSATFVAPSSLGASSASAASADLVGPPPDPLARVRELPPDDRYPSLDAYFDAIDGRAHLSALTDAGRTPRGPAARPPADVPVALWHEARALTLHGITPSDARAFALDGRLPDELDADGAVVRRGEDRLAALERAAAGRGDWTAVNALGVLLGARAAALSAEARALAAAPLLPTQPAVANADAAPVGPTPSADAGVLTGEAEGLRAHLQAIFSAATTAREDISRSALDRARRATTHADAARARGDLRGAAAHERRAQVLRDRAATTALAEAEYRSERPRLKHRAGSTLVLAAEAQVETGRAHVASARRASGPLPASPPAALGRDDGARTVSRVPGAETLLGRARAHGGDPHAILDVEVSRQRVIGDFHAVHLARGGDQDTHRVAHVRARVGAVAALGERLDHFGAPARLAPPEALRAAAVAQTRTEVLDELATELAAPLASARLATELEVQVELLREALPSALAAEQDGAAARAASLEVYALAKAADQPTWDLRTAAQQRGDRAAVRDAATIAVADIQVAAAVADERRQVETLLAQAEAARAKAQLQLLTDLRHASAERTGLQGQAWAHSPAGPYVAVRDESDRTAELGEAYLDRAETPGASPALTGEIAVRRVAFGARWADSVAVDRAAFGPSNQPDATARLDHSAAALAKSQRTIEQLEAGSAAQIAAIRGAVLAESKLGALEGELRPGRARDHLLAAERNVEALPPTQREAAHGEVGRAAVQALIGADGALEDIARRRAWVPEAADDLNALAHRALAETRAGSDPANAEACSVLRAFDGSLHRVASAWVQAGTQLEQGLDLAAAVTHTTGRREATVEQSKVARSVVTVSVVFGPELRTRIADVAEDAVGVRMGEGTRLTNRYLAGRDQLGAAWETAMEQGQPLRILHALRLSASGPGAVAAHARALLDDLIRAPGPAPAWRDFWKVAVLEAAVPATAPLLRPLSIAASAMPPKGPAMTRPALVNDVRVATIEDGAQALDEAADGAAAVALANVALETIALSMAARAFGSMAVVARLRSAVPALEAFGAAGQQLARLRDAHRIAATMASTAAAGAASVVVSRLAQQTFGASSTASLVVDILGSLVPIGVPLRALRTERVVERLASAGLAGAQAGAASAIAPWVSERLGARTENQQVAVGLLTTTLLAGGVAAFGHARAAGARSPASIPFAKLGDAGRARVTREVQSFLARIPERIPTIAEGRALAVALGRVKDAAGQPLPADQVQSLVETVTAQRAADLALGARGTGVDAPAAVQAVDRVARGLVQASEGTLGEPRAMALASWAVAQRLHAHVPRETTIRAAVDRGTAWALVHAVGPSVPAAARPRVEAEVQGALAASRRALTGPSADDGTTSLAAGGPLHRQAVERLIQAGLPGAEAEQLVARTHDTAIAGVITERLVRLQSSRSEPLSRVQLDALADELAPRAGLTPASARARVARIAASDPLRAELAATARDRGSAFSEHRAAVQKGLADGPRRALSTLSKSELIRAFGDGALPRQAVLLAEQRGFADFCRSHPSEARRLVEAVGFFRSTEAEVMALIGALSARHARPAEGYRAALAQLEPMLPILEPHPTLPGFSVVRRGPRSPSDVPEIRLVVDRELDPTGAFHLPPAPGTSGKLAGTRMLDHGVARADQLIVNGQPLKSLDGVLVFSGHGSPDGIANLDADQVAHAIADQLQGAAIRVVVLDACHQRNAVGNTSSGESIRAALDTLLAARGMAPVTVLVSEASGVITKAASGRTRPTQAAKLRRTNQRVPLRMVPADHRRHDLDARAVNRARQTIGDTLGQAARDAGTQVVTPED